MPLIRRSELLEREGTSVGFVVAIEVLSYRGCNRLLIEGVGKAVGDKDQYAHQLGTPDASRAEQKL